MMEFGHQSLDLETTTLLRVTTRGKWHITFAQPSVAAEPDGTTSLRTPFTIDPQPPEWNVNVTRILERVDSPSPLVRLWRWVCRLPRHSEGSPE